ncbi:MULTISPECIES: esterase/lipase family protein [Catenuloplanes]|uniref:DUF676 domain-containing protein n=1 Tax=Catenuloplanes niger TaxID=587534 RepID=A0AAE3ZKT0_9ACTN|nr:hypothetical protein [Catenuloplanes niger]MDR7321769.1 hypothetical protein [Catenuloplanes niger]
MKLLTMVCALVLAATPAGAAAPRHAPVDRPGPPLSVPVATLRAAVTCTPDAYRARAEVILFVPATALDPGQFAWNWFPALRRAGHPWCAVTLPDHALGDIQVTAEYVVHAIRHAHAVSGRRIAVVGHSQGALDARFALRFWPDTRAMVADHVSLGSPHHGSTGNDTSFPPGTPGPAALLQMRTTAALIEAVNAGRETFPEISYTTVASRYDQYVTPTSTVALRGRSVANVVVQDVCPANTVEHVGLGTADPVGHALVMDAVRHDGPARPGRLPTDVCARDLMPGVDPATYPRRFAETNAAIVTNLGTATPVTEEPPLQPYVVAR